MFIVTHTNPDFDAITGVWLLKRFGGLAEAEIKFTNTGNPDASLLAEAVAVVDTGKEYDENRLRFDHHQLPGNAANDTCAAKQVYDLLVFQNPTIEYLQPLVELIFAGDTGRIEAKASRDLGIHALLSGFKAQAGAEKRPLDDLAALTFGFMLLDNLAVRLQNQAKIKAELAEKVVFKSADNLLWAIRHGSSGSSFAAFEEGARVVVFEGEPVDVEGGTTYPIGLMRAGEWQEPHCGNLVQAVLDTLVGSEPMYHELSMFFRHNSGFFAGRGTPKAPVYEPVTIDLVALAELVDLMWIR